VPAVLAALLKENPFMAASKNPIGYSSAPEREAIAIGTSVMIAGEVFSKEDLTVNGEVEGSMDVEGHRLTIGPQGTLKGHVKAREVVLLGTIHGNVEVTDRIELRDGSKMIGDVVATRLIIEDGAYFKGSIDIRKAAAKAEWDSSRRGVNTANRSDFENLENRYDELVEKKYVTQLSKAEELEMQRLAAKLSTADDDFYQPVLQRLRKEKTAAHLGLGEREASR
jgi:cytoskeletal protein CcmA (bactofilin family)